MYTDYESVSNSALKCDDRSMSASPDCLLALPLCVLLGGLPGRVCSGGVQLRLVTPLGARENRQRPRL